jgi:hypothetical protein
MSTANIPPLRTNEPEPVPAPAPPRVAGTGYLECDFCHCKLTKTGEVYQVSEQAREFRDQGEKHRKAIEKLDEQIADMQKQVAAKDAEIATLKGSPAPKRAGIRVER